MAFLKWLASMFGPVLMCWLAVNLAFVAGKMGNWWPVLLAMLMAGSAIVWASSVAEAQAKSKWAAVLYETLVRGRDTTITIEHFHSDGKRVEP